MSVNGKTRTARQTQPSAEDAAFVAQHARLLDLIINGPTAAGVLQIPEIEEQVYDHYDRRFGAVAHSDAWHHAEALKAEWTQTVDAAIVKIAHRIDQDQGLSADHLASPYLNASDHARNSMSLVQLEAAEAALQEVVAQRQQRAIQRRRERQAAMEMHAEQQRATMRLEHQQQMEREAAQHAHELKLKDLDLEAERQRGQREETDRDKMRSLELSKRRLDSVDEMIRAMILAQAELRDNPLAEELMGRFRAVYSTLDRMGFRVELDEESLRDLLERVALRDFTKKTGIQIE